MEKQSVLKGLFALLVVVLLAELAGCEPQLVTPQGGQSVSLLATATFSPLFLTIVADDVRPTSPPSPTPPPLPTPLPTPQVTPIPTAVPPIIPEVVDKVPQPYTLVFRDGNVIRAIHSSETHERTLVDIRAHGLFFLPGGERIKTSSEEWGSPSPDGKRLALVLGNVERWESWPKGEKPTYGVYVLDLSTEQLQLLAPSGVEPVWSPDNTQIAYRDTQTSGLWVIDVATGKAREIYAVDQKNEHFVSEMDWSPDGRRIVFIDEVFRQSHTLMIVDAQETEFATVLVPSSTYWPSFPKWSPSGNKILFIYNAGKSSSSCTFYNLWVMNPDGTDQTQLTQDMYVHRPRWSPDGQWIAFDGPLAYEEPDPYYELWLINRAGNQLKRLTSNAVNKVTEAMPAWSPDGKQIFFMRGTSFTRGEYEMWIISLANGVQTKLPSSVTSNLFVLR